jgi:hypothetical protein
LLGCDPTSDPPPTIDEPLPTMLFDPVFDPVFVAVVPPRPFWNWLLLTLGMT